MTLLLTSQMLPSINKMGVSVKLGRYYQRYDDDIINDMMTKFQSKNR